MAFRKSSARSARGGGGSTDDANATRVGAPRWGASGAACEYGAPGYGAGYGANGTPESVPGIPGIPGIPGPGIPGR